LLANKAPNIQLYYYLLLYPRKRLGCSLKKEREEEIKERGQMFNYEKKRKRRREREEKDPLSSPSSL
jgi:hypothetical protein